jgi:hypothetical protein
MSQPKRRKKIGRNYILKEALESGTSRTRILPSKKNYKRKKGTKKQTIEPKESE